jgi:segregation and condensation protein A
VVAVVYEEQDGFIVRLPCFTGTLSELAYALRSHAISPQALDVYQLVKDYLAYFEDLARHDLNLASEALPMVARVIELKVRFLLPRPPKEEAELEEELLEQALEAVAILEELEEAIVFLKERREARRIMLPARAPRPDYPRVERPIKVSLDKLMEMASRYSFSSYFELAIERLTMAGAMKQLLSALKRLRRGRLFELLEQRSWPVATVTFAGMLELLKEGKVQAVQEAPFAPIEVELVKGQAASEALEENVTDSSSEP